MGREGAAPGAATNLDFTGAPDEAAEAEKVDPVSRSAMETLPVQIACLNKHEGWQVYIVQVEELVFVHIECFQCQP